MNARTATLTIGAVFALAVPTANASTSSVIIGDGGAAVAPVPGRSPAAIKVRKNHKSVPPTSVAANHDQVVRNMI